ncbi:four helix bundle protein [Kibdelosporangium aridum]|uniref:Four helix bundle protein n=1 Tax=Kibdelosporangium aridum TaxID=2030 RepID=A0A428Z3B5_KIBAR|nr:four helix bundle protein [Kibdelosporangium aridum]RSM80415.1 four helix bundle protein [Kibdelosporangium aridum]
MSHQLDRALDELDNAMKQLKRAMRGVPANREGFRRQHDRAAKEVAALTVALTDSRSACAG